VKIGSQEVAIGGKYLDVPGKERDTGWRAKGDKKLQKLYSPPHITRMIKSPRK
jgi:hypothetical protein